MGKLNYSLITFALILFLVPAVSGELTCSLSPNSCETNEVTLFKMYQTTNSHAQLVTQTGYNNYVCCSDSFIELGTSCSGDFDVVLNLFKETNSHVQENTYSDYTHEVCLSGGTGAISVDCDYASDCTSLGSGYVCVASIAQETNSHIAVCDYYPIQVCCSVVGDSTPPEATININNGEVATNDENVVLFLTFDDPESGILDPGCRYRNSGVSYADLETCTSTRSWTLSESDGFKKVFYKVFNELRIPTEVSDIIILDRGFPSITLDPHTTPTTDNTPSFSGTATDQTSNIDLIQYQVVERSTQDEVIPLTDVDLFTSSDSVDYTFTTDTLSDGKYRVDTTAFDQAGNEVEVKANQDIDVDTTAPVTTDSYDGEDHSSPHTVTLECTDNVAGCKETKYCVYDEGVSQCTPDTVGTSVELTCPVGSVCKKIIAYHSTDNVDIVEAVKNSLVITIDGSLPQCEIEELEEYRTDSLVPLYWSGSDPSDRTIIRFDIYLKGPGDTEWQHWDFFGGSIDNAQFIASSEGFYEFSCTATNDLDVEGGKSNTVHTTYDATSPTVTIVQLPEWTPENSFVVEWSGSDDISGVNEFTVEYKEEGEPSFQFWGTFPNDIFSAVFGPDLPVETQDGKKYELMVTANDLAGNNGQSTVTSTTLDLSEPVCSIVPLSPTTSTETFTLEWHGADHVSGIESYEIEVSSDLVNWSQLYSGQDTSAEFTGTEGDLYYFQCRALDVAGNLGSFSSPEDTIIDTGPPVLSVTILPVNPIVLDEIIVEATATDVAGVSELTLTFNGTEVHPDTDDILTDSRSAIWSLGVVGEEGEFTFTIYVEDASGNSDTQEYTFTLIECNDDDEKECGSNIGACVVGKRICIDNTWGFCVDEVEPSIEQCDGIDNDCDSITDEDLSNPSCILTRGVCAGATQVCLGTSGWGSCNSGSYGSFYQQTEDICDTLDNDCDGQTDEGCLCTPGEEIECGTSDVFPCRKGIQLCQSDNTWSECTDAVEPIPEVCDNNIDDNCNGFVDDGCDPTVNGGDPGFPMDESSILVIVGIVVIIIAIMVLFFIRAKSKGASWSKLFKRYGT